MKIKSIINALERYNTLSNESIKLVELQEVPADLIAKTQAQNEILENMFNEFNMDNNSFVYKFTNTTDTKVKTITFESPVYIGKAAMKIDDFIYSNLVRFKMTFYTIDNASITYFMLPYEYRGEYIEEIKFNAGQTRSNFKTINNNKLVFYDIVKNSLGEIDLQKLSVDYHDSINDEGYILFNTQHKKDKLAIKYTPISSEFIREVNDRITSVTLEVDNDIPNEIVLNVINQ